MFLSYDRHDMFCRTIRLGLLFVSATIIAGCGRTIPLVSHAHVGHALTAWHDTPGEGGLFLIAEQELANALKEVELAKLSIDSPPVASIHVNNVIHSLNPDIQPRGSGEGYGAIRALQGAMDHIGFAAESDDASENLRQASVAFKKEADGVLDQFVVATAAARLVGESKESELEDRLHDLTEELIHCEQGRDLDNDGIIGGRPGEAGLLQLRRTLSDILVNESSPPYHPVGRRYLFGVVKLPNGRWGYRFDKSDPYDGRSQSN